METEEFWGTIEDVLKVKVEHRGTAWQQSGFLKMKSIF